MPRSDHSAPDQLQNAISVLNRARESMLDHLAEQVVSMEDEFAEGGFQINEFLDMHGTRLHFLCLMIGQFEMLRETRLAESSTRAKDRRPKSSTPEAPTSPSTEESRPGKFSERKPTTPDRKG